MTDGPADLQFVVLKHCDRDGVHWDLLVETGPDSPLRTWRLRDDPSLHVGTIPATQIADHRRLYLDFEGALMGGRGTVVRVDRGPVRWLASATDERRLCLMGSKIRGVYVLRKLEAKGWVFEPGRED